MKIRLQSWEKQPITGSILEEKIGIIITFIKTKFVLHFMVNLV